MAEIEGLVRALRRALREGDNAAKTGAARALGSLACSHANRVLIAAAGGIPPLVELLCDGSAYAKLSAAWALRNLARLENNKVLIAEAGGIPSLVELLRDGDAAAALARAAGAAGHRCFAGSSCAMQTGANLASKATSHRLRRPT